VLPPQPNSPPDIVSRVDRSIERAPPAKNGYYAASPVESTKNSQSDNLNVSEPDKYRRQSQI